MSFFGEGQNGEKRDAILTPNELDFTFNGSDVYANFGENRSRNTTVSVPTNGNVPETVDTKYCLVRVDPSQADF